MSKNVYRLRAGNLDFSQVTAYFLEQMGDELLHAARYQVAPMQSTLCVFERYYLRTNSTASLTVLFTNTGQEILVDVVSSGAGSGLLNISWGASSNFANKALDALKAMGFSEY